MRRLLLIKGLLGWLFCVLSMAVYASSGITVVASFSILADLVEQVGGSHVTVDMLVKPDHDMHVYQPTPKDIRRIHAADVLVVNGLGFEGWLESWSKRQQKKGPLIIVASNGILPIEQVHAHCADHRHGARHHAADPHAWHSILNVMRYVDNIAAGLSRADPAYAEIYRKNAAAYKQQLMALDTMLMKQFSAIPANQRRVITSHNAFQYFAKRYGLTFIGLQGVNAESEASAAAVASVIRQIRESNIRALFIENVSNARLLSQISRETGVAIGGRLYSDALSDSKGLASTYLEMLRHNGTQLVQALSVKKAQ